LECQHLLSGAVCDPVFRVREAAPDEMLCQRLYRSSIPGTAQDAVKALYGTLDTLIACIEFEGFETAK